MPHLQVIIGSTREDRFAARVADWVADRLKQRSDLTLEIVDLLDFQLPFFDAAAPAKTGRD